LQPQIQNFPEGSFEGAACLLINGDIAS